MSSKAIAEYIMSIAVGIDKDSFSVSGTMAGPCCSIIVHEKIGRLITITEDKVTWYDKRMHRWLPFNMNSDEEIMDNVIEAVRINKVRRYI